MFFSCGKTITMRFQKACIVWATLGAAFVAHTWLPCSVAHAQRASRRAPSQRASAQRVSGQGIDPRLQETPAALLTGNYYEHDRKPLAVGTQAPSFVLPLAQEYLAARGASSPAASVTSRVLDLEKFRGGPEKSRPVTVVIFWAFWCDTWKDATRHLKTLRKPLQDGGVRVACVAVDASQQPVARKAFAAGDIWFPVAIDRESKITHQWGVRRVPTIFVLDSAGKVRHCFEGFPLDRKLIAAIQAAR
jgi:peroxiredoxin